VPISPPGVQRRGCFPGCKRLLFLEGQGGQPHRKVARRAGARTSQPRRQVLLLVAADLLLLASHRRRGFLLSEDCSVGPILYVISAPVLLLFSRRPPPLPRQRQACQRGETRRTRTSDHSVLHALLREACICSRSRLSARTRSRVPSTAPDAGPLLLLHRPVSSLAAAVHTYHRRPHTTRRELCAGAASALPRTVCVRPAPARPKHPDSRASKARKAAAHPAHPSIHGRAPGSHTGLRHRCSICLWYRTQLV